MKIAKALNNMSVDNALRNYNEYGVYLYCKDGKVKCAVIEDMEIPLEDGEAALFIE